MQDIDATGESDSVDGTISISAEVINDLNNSGARKSAKRLCAKVLSTLLCHVQGKADCFSNLLRKR